MESLTIGASTVAWPIVSSPRVGAEAWLVLVSLVLLVLVRLVVIGAGSTRQLALSRLRVGGGADLSRFVRWASWPSHFPQQSALL